MVLIDPDGLDELSANLRAGVGRVRDLAVPAGGHLDAVGQTDLAGTVTRLLDNAGTALELLANDLATRAATMRDTEAAVISRAARVTAFVGASQVTGATPQPPGQVWNQLRRLHQLRLIADRLADLGLPAARHTIDRASARLTDGLTIADWREVSLLEAGIDAAGWRPSLGLAANDHAVQAVYDFYARLQLDHSEFQWAGMAATVGAMLYAGWQDVHTIRRLPDDARRWFLPRVLNPLPPSGTLVPPLRPGWAAHVTAAELEWLEVRMLSMQREIFDDLAWMHVAYRYGGLGALLPHLSGPEYASARRAWIDIASGDPARVASGNALLLRREQLEIIQDDYDDIRAHHGPSGESLTRLLTWTADSSIPGARPYRDVVVRTVEVPMVGFDEPQAWPPWELVPIAYDPVILTLPRGNIATFADRWEWIESDLLPAYLSLHSRSADLRELLSEPVAVRAARERILPVLPQ